MKLTNLHHLAQFGQVASDEVEEGELVEVLGPLIAHFHHLVVSLQQRRLAQTLPAAALVQSLGCLQGHLKARTEERFVIFAQVLDQFAALTTNQPLIVEK